MLRGSHECSPELKDNDAEKAACVPLRGEITLLFWVCPQADCGGGQIVVLRVVCVGEREGVGGACV